MSTEVTTERMIQTGVWKRRGGIGVCCHLVMGPNGRGGVIPWSDRNGSVLPPVRGVWWQGYGEVCAATWSEGHVAGVWRDTCPVYRLILAGSHFILLEFGVILTNHKRGCKNFIKLPVGN